MSNSRNQDDHLNETLKQFWDTESIGIKEPCCETQTKADKFVDIKFNGERYEASLPWKDDNEPIPSVYQLCYNRLRSLHQKLRRDPQLLEEYDQTIKEQLQMEIIEEVPQVESNNKFSEDVHYLPHHAVLRQDRQTTKVRVVYDGSAKSPNIVYSLNDCLQVGPNYIPQLFDVLLKFRWNPIALTADIEKVFLMVAINEANRDMLRFLWFKNPNEHIPEVIQL